MSDWSLFIERQLAADQLAATLPLAGQWRAERARFAIPLNEDFFTQGAVNYEYYLSAQVVYWRHECQLCLGGGKHTLAHPATPFLPLPKCCICDSRLWLYPRAIPIRHQATRPIPHRSNFVRLKNWANCCKKLDIFIDFPKPPKTCVNKLFILFDRSDNLSFVENMSVPDSEVKCCILHRSVFSSLRNSISAFQTLRST